MALGIRVAWMLAFAHVIDNEGAEYARLADNLIAGNGYIGIFGGPHALFPPLYPMLIGALTFLTHNSELSARLVSLLAGAATIWPLYRIGARFGGERAGMAVGGIAAVHGLLIALSSAAYSESTYFCLIAWGLHLALAALDGEKWQDGVMPGLVFGLAYLVRPEALVYPFFLILFLLAPGFRPPSPFRRGLARAGVVLLTTGLVMAPYVAWLSAASGYFRIEGKSASNGVIAGRMHRGLSYQEAVRGLTPEGLPEGPYLQADQIAILPAGGSTGAGMIAALSARPMARLTAIAREAVTTEILGGLAFFALAALGIGVTVAKSPGSRSLWFLLLASASYVVPLMTMEQRWERHLYPIGLFLVPWAGIGAAWVWSRLDSRPTGTAPRLLPGAWMVVVAAGTAVPTALAARTAGEFAQAGSLALRDAGRWIGATYQGSAAPKVMGMSSPLAYYADATLAYLPYSDAASALAYIRVQRPDFLVLRTQDAAYGQAPYIGAWLADGIPDPCATLARDFPEGPEGVLRVYKWSCP